jgi:hypothetical protein
MRYLEKRGVNGSLGDLNAKYYIEIALDSTETKPTEMVAAGSIALETDTGKVYVFNENTSAWILYKTVKEG